MVKRYDMVQKGYTYQPYWIMEEAKYGNWVDWDDYENLKETLDRVSTEVKILTLLLNGEKDKEDSKLFSKHDLFKDI